MKIAVEGCAHGELEKIYEALEYAQLRQNIKIDLLICCGDFQSTRNNSDLKCMAVPQKYEHMCSFYKYYSGEKLAPVLTIFIGGNHEASNYLQELSFGGWVAPRIYYMGYAGVVNVGGLRIAGLSGIYKGQDYMKGHFEKPPYTNESKRSVYHVRNLEVFRLKQLSNRIDIFISHDWPKGVYHHGNVEQLKRFKPFLTDEINSDSLGSKPGEELLYHLKPSFWFAAHLHAKFAAIINHNKDPDSTNEEITKFLALDKCLPKRRFLQILDVPHDTSRKLELEYDLEWLTVLHLTNHLLSVNKTTQYMPGPGSNTRWNFTPTEEELKLINLRFNKDLVVPNNFTQTVRPYSPSNTPNKEKQPSAQINPQTMVFCDKVGIDDPMCLLLDQSSGTSGLFDSSQISTCSLPSFLSPGQSVIELSSDDSFEMDEKKSLSLPDPVEPYTDDDDKLSLSLPETKTQKPKMSLSLPKPKFDEYNNDSKDELHSLVVDLIDTELRKKSSDDIEFQNNCEAGKRLSPSHMDPENRKIERCPKKFKRRNESIYSASEVD